MLKDGKYNLPEDLKKMDDSEREKLAAEIRGRLIEVVSKNGGHLASNLGIVELTIALYSIYNPFSDKIIWDVGHQSYVHKILTGRNDRFDTLRKTGGLSGFPKRSESPADAFGTGHSSTSVSAALGLARAAKINGEACRVVAVIGDGALTGGMAFEALNDLAQSKCPVTVVLNDNGMSISRNVGGLSRYLGKIRSRHSYTQAKKHIKSFLEKLPLVGAPIAKLLHAVKRSIKVLLIPGELFEDLGLEYAGPVDGHNIKAVRNALIHARDTNKPVVVHVITKKGKGYKPAEKNPALFHGIGPFDRESGEPVRCGGKSYSDAFAEKIVEMAEKDEKIVAVTAAMPTGTGLELFSEKIHDRFFDVGIAESHAITMAAGMSAGGIKPVIAVYSTFLQRAYDQLLHDVALQNLPLVIGLDRSGINGRDGETHQGIYDFAYLGHIPNVTVAAPASVEEMQKMTELAFSVYNPEMPELHGCFVIRYGAREPDSENISIINKGPALEYGKGAVIYDSAPSLSEADYLFMAVGATLTEALSAAKRLAEEGKHAIVFNPRFVYPVDENAIISLAKNAEVIITTEEAVIDGGFGKTVENILYENKIASALKIIALPKEPIPHGAIADIKHKYLLDADGIYETAKEFFDETHADGFFGNDSGTVNGETDEA